MARQLIRAGWIVADVGANIGYYTLLFSRLVGRDGLVYAFEPEPTTFRQLLQHTEVNRVTNVRAYQLALGQEPGERHLLKHRDPAQVRLSAMDEPGDIKTRVVTLDTFVRNRRIPNLDFVKVDIEGMEPGFLRGAEETLRKFRPVIMIEMNPAALRHFGFATEDIATILRSHGYVLYRPTWRGLVPWRDEPRRGTYWNVVAFAPDNELIGQDGGDQGKHAHQ